MVSIDWYRRQALAYNVPCIYSFFMWNRWGTGYTTGSLSSCILPTCALFIAIPILQWTRGSIMCSANKYALDITLRMNSFIQVFASPNFDQLISWHQTKKQKMRWNIDILRIAICPCATFSFAVQALNLMASHVLKSRADSCTWIKFVTKHSRWNYLQAAAAV